MRSVQIVAGKLILRILAGGCKQRAKCSIFLGEVAPLEYILKSIDLTNKFHIQHFKKLYFGGAKHASDANLANKTLLLDWLN